MPTILQFRRGTSAQNDNYTGSLGELTIDADLDVIRVHDGSTPGGHALVGKTATQTLTNKTLTSPDINSNINLKATAALQYFDTDNSNYVGFKAPGTIAANVSWTLPSADAGVSGYALVSDSAGTLSWAPAGATITNDETTNTNFLLYFASTTTGALTAAKQDSGLTYNPSTGRLSASQLGGTLQTASQTNITGLGTITTGTWSATTIATSKGGTGLTSFTSGGALYATSTSALTTGTLPVASGGTGVTSSTGSGAVVLSTSPTFATKIITPVIEKNGTNGVGDIGQSGNKYATIYATTFNGTASTANYADLAEKYVADRDYEPGTVMVFGGDNEVTESMLEYETGVAGVISTNPAYLMNSEQQGEFVVDIALVGRVPCKVMGPVFKGSVLVTSEHNGVAKAINNSKFIPGCIIGRAMEDHREEGIIKIIEVSVGRS